MTARARPAADQRESGSHLRPPDRSASLTVGPARLRLRHLRTMAVLLRLGKRTRASPDFTQELPRKLRSANLRRIVRGSWTLVSIREGLVRSPFTTLRRARRAFSCEFLLDSFPSVQWPDVGTALRISALEPIAARQRLDG